MNIDDTTQRPAIDYPTTWEYKVIGRDENDLRAAVATVVAGRGEDGSQRRWDLTASRVSKGGQYVSLRLRTAVASETERDALFQALSMHPAVRLVI